MGRILPLRARGDVFLDVRGEGRALEVSWHHEGEVVVLSLWRAGSCAATFRLAKDDVPAFIQSLTAGLAEGYGGQHTKPRTG